MCMQKWSGGHPRWVTPASPTALWLLLWGGGLPALWSRGPHSAFSLAHEPEIREVGAGDGGAVRGRAVRWARTSTWRCPWSILSCPSVMDMIWRRGLGIGLICSWKWEQNEHEPPVIPPRPEVSRARPTSLLQIAARQAPGPCSQVRIQEAAASFCNRLCFVPEEEY